MNFGKAIEALKQGKKVTRKGWNGKGMFLWLKPATVLKSDFLHDPILKQAVEDNGGTMNALGTICMKTADNQVLTGWLASQTDMLSEDWRVVGDECADKYQIHVDHCVEQNRMGEAMEFVQRALDQWVEADKKNRGFILIATDKNLPKDDKKTDTQTMFAMQGDEGLNAFSVQKVFAQKEGKTLKTMMATCLIIDKFAGTVFK